VNLVVDKASSKFGTYQLVFSDTKMLDRPIGAMSAGPVTYRDTVDLEPNRGAAGSLRFDSNSPKALDYREILKMAGRKVHNDRTNESQPLSLSDLGPKNH
jgi:hypothetical protein